MQRPCFHVHGKNVNSVVMHIIAWNLNTTCCELPLYISTKIQNLIAACIFPLRIMWTSANNTHETIAIVRNVSQALGCFTSLLIARSVLLSPDIQICPKMIWLGAVNWAIRVKVLLVRLKSTENRLDYTCTSIVRRSNLGLVWATRSEVSRKWNLGFSKMYSLSFWSRPSSFRWACFQSFELIHKTCASLRLPFSVLRLWMIDLGEWSDFRALPWSAFLLEDFTDIETSDFALNALFKKLSNGCNRLTFNSCVLFLRFFTFLQSLFNQWIKFLHFHTDLVYGAKIRSSPIVSRCTSLQNR